MVSTIGAWIALTSPLFPNSDSACISGIWIFRWNWTWFYFNFLSQIFYIQNIPTFIVSQDSGNITSLSAGSHKAQLSEIKAAIEL